MIKSPHERSLNAGFREGNDSYVLVEEAVTGKRITRCSSFSCLLVELR